MKYRKLLAIIAICSLALCGCDNGGGSNGGTDIPTGDDPDSTVTDDTGPGIQEPDDGGEGGNTGDGGGNTGDSNPDSYTRYQRYYYEPYKSDFSSSGNTLNKNGLTWSYTSAPVNNDDSTYERGIQIASGGGATGWTFSTNFGEDVCLEDFEVGLSVSSSGSFTAAITFGDYNLGTVNTTSQSVTDFELDGNYYIGDSLTFKCTSGSKSCYLKYIAFTVYTLPNSSLTLTSDVGEGDYDDKILDRKYSASDVNTYYSSINDSMSGDTLFNALFSISTIKTKYSYGDVRYCLPYTDCGVKDTDHLYGLFDGASLVPGWDQGSTWNREHVWPQSKLGESGSLGASTTDARSDLHNLRASSISSNSAKGDKYLDNTNTSSTFYPNYGGEGDHRGDVARICFYMYLMYRDSNGLELSDAPASGTSTTYGILSTMLVWNQEDEPDDFEIQRNNRVEEYQGNRNPFIDHPEYASRIFS